MKNEQRPPKYTTPRGRPTLSPTEQTVRIAGISLLRPVALELQAYARSMGLSESAAIRHIVVEFFLPVDMENARRLADLRCKLSEIAVAQGAFDRAALALVDALSPDDQ